MAEAADCAQEREQRNSFHLQREMSSFVPNGVRKSSHLRRGR
jgi:hypothetical protein